MRRSAAALTFAALMVVVGPAPAPLWAQAKDPAKDQPKDPAKQPGKAPAEPSKTTGDKKAPNFPAKVQKNLYATKDVRGKSAPKMHVQKWLTAEPETAGKVVLIDFWATWCPPCRKLIPELNDFSRKFKDDLVVIGISDENEAKVREFLGKTSASYAMAVDTSAKMKNELGVSGIPHVLVIGTDGVVRWQGFPQDSADMLDEAKLRQIIDADKAQRAKKPAKDGKDSKDDKKPEPAKKGG